MPDIGASTLDRTARASTIESEVRFYSRHFPTVFKRATGSLLYDMDDRRYIDFLAGAGSLNYGHNNPHLRAALIAYLNRDGPISVLDMETEAKQAFLETFSAIVLRPKSLSYKVQFCGPTGTNAVEAALKLARKITGRTGSIAFTGGYHGMSMGSLAATGNKGSRRGAGVPLSGVTFVPFEYGPMGTFDSAAFIDHLISDPCSGVDMPASILLETVQADGGINVASAAWLESISDLCQRHKIILIHDDIQVGCGRAGTFFSYERAKGITPPDIIALSKSISGFGLPLSLLLIRPEHDVWAPGEHTGTFRANQAALITATAALDYWRDDSFSREIMRKQSKISAVLESTVRQLEPRILIRGIGLIWGIDFAPLKQPDFARRIGENCFRRGLIIECCGRNSSVLKLLPPLLVEDELLDEALAILHLAIRETC